MWVLVIIILLIIFFSSKKSKSSKNTEQTSAQTQTNRGDTPKTAEQSQKQKREYDAETKRLYKEVYQKLKGLEMPRYSKHLLTWSFRKEYMDGLDRMIKTIQKAEKTDTDGTYIRQLLLSESFLNWMRTYMYLKKAKRKTTDSSMRLPH